MVVGKSVYFLSFCQAKLQVMADILDVGDMEPCVPYKPQQSALALETVKQLFTGNRVEMTLMLEHWEGCTKASSIAFISTEGASVQDIRERADVVLW